MVGRGTNLIQKTAREPDHLVIIHYSLLHTNFGKITREEGRRSTSPLYIYKPNFSDNNNSVISFNYSRSILSLAWFCVAHSILPQGPEGQRPQYRRRGGSAVVRHPSPQQKYGFSFYLAIRDIMRGQGSLRGVRYCTTVYR